MAQGGSNKKVANSLVGVSFAAVLAVYSAGYARTRSAASQFEAQSSARRPVAPQAAIAPVREIHPAQPIAAPQSPSAREPKSPERSTPAAPSAAHASVN